MLADALVGCKDAYTKYGLDPRTNLLRLKVEEPYVVINEVIEKHQEITAYIIQNVFVGSFVYLVRERRLEIPEKLSVVMFNDEALDDSQRGYFTFLPGGTNEMGKEGVKSLIEISRGRVEKVDITISNKIELGQTAKNILD